MVFITIIIYLKGLFMTYNFYFDIAAIFIFLVIIMFYSQQNFVQNVTQRIFITLWWVALFIPLADIISVISYDAGDQDLYYFSNIIYYLGQQFAAWLFFMYAISPLVRFENMTKSKLILSIAPIAFISLLILTTPWTGLIFSYDGDTGSYTLGILNVLCYIVSLAYYGSSIYYPIRMKEIYNIHMQNAMKNTLVLILGFLVVQIANPTLLCVSFAISLSMLQLLIITMKEHPTEDLETGFLSSDAFYDYSNKLIYNKLPFTIITVRMADYEMMQATYGAENLHQLATTVCKELGSLAQPRRAFQLDEDSIAFIYENQAFQDTILLEQEMDCKLGQKWTVNNIYMSFSHYIVSFEYDKDFDSTTTLRRLTAALRRHSSNRYGIMSVDQLQLGNSQREAQVEHALADAINKRRFELYYQPIYSPKQGRFVTAEALIRLNDSLIGPIGPGEFIPVAERSDLIMQIGDFILEAAFKFVRDHDLKALGLDYIEVNLSTIQCLQKNFILNLFELLNKYNINPHLICFEITETASTSAPKVFLQNLQSLHEAGFKLAIDDFGTGYGNLNRLISNDFDIVKFDKGTTEQICSDEKIRPIFEKMVTMIHSMNCTVVAEGIETAEQNDFLTGIGTDCIQGYYYSKPVNQSQFIEFLREHNK